MNGHLKDMCLQEIGLHAPILTSILNSVVFNNIGRTYNIWPFNEHGNLQSDNELTRKVTTLCDI